MNVAEYIVTFLEEKKTDRIFGVVGGAALWLCKAFSESTKIRPVFTNHEQAAVMAADGWARITRKPGVVFTINGPGMTNTVTGIAQAWVDSSPIILLTGNSNLKSVRYERERKMRQYGTQDVDTGRIMRAITKKTFLLERAEDVRACLEEAYETAVCGRPGPVCIEIPINIQSAEVPQTMRGWEVQSGQSGQLAADFAAEKLDGILEKLLKAERPLILAGQGIRLAGAVERFREFVKRYQIPVVNSRMGIDTIASDSEYFIGRCGNHGSRPSHFAIQTCDVMLILGSRLSPNTTGYDVDKFSGQSYKILVEVDGSESEKYGLVINEKAVMDLGDFLQYALEYIRGREAGPEQVCHQHWISCCNDWKRRYPVMQEEYSRGEKISTYQVVEAVSDYAGEQDLILSDTGSCCSIVAQQWRVKERQRVFISGGLSAMGYWATATGLAIGNDGSGSVICFVGDGSLQMNIHELATLKRYGLPVKMIVVSNNGYQFVRMSQSGYGIEPPFGTDVAAGVPIPDIREIVQAYGVEYLSCHDTEALAGKVEALMQTKGTAVLEVFVAEDQEVCPRLKSVALADGTFVSPNYENLYPFLEEDVLKEELGKAFQAEAERH